MFQVELTDRMKAFRKIQMTIFAFLLNSNQKHSSVVLQNDSSLIWTWFYWGVDELTMLKVIIQQKNDHEHLLVVVYTLLVELLRLLNSDVL